MKYEKITRTIWNKLKKAIEKDLDLKLDKADSGKYKFGYITVKYDYNDKKKTLTIDLPWIVPKKAKATVDNWIKREISSKGQIAKTDKKKKDEKAK